MKKTNKCNYTCGFAHLILIIGVVLVGIVGVVLFIYKYVFGVGFNFNSGPAFKDASPNLDFKSQSSELDPETTSSWKTYRNHTLNYTFKYPNNWNLGESTSQGYPYIAISDPIAQDTFPGQTEYSKGALFQIYVDNKDPWYTNKSLQEILPLTNRAGPHDNYSPNILESNIKGVIYTRKDASGNTMVEGSLYTKGFGFEKTINSKDAVFDISIMIFRYDNLAEEDLRNYIEILDQILSTFEFIDE